MMKPTFKHLATPGFLPGTRQPTVKNRLLFLAGLVIFYLVTAISTASASSDGFSTFKWVPTQFIAALGDPGATSGTGAQDWGLWRQDPGPRGVWLHNYSLLESTGGIAPAQWQFDQNDWWLDENGLIMEQPEFPIPPGKYIVTGNREAIAMLTIYPADENGERRWELGNEATLHDVTHLGCRSARYTPAAASTSCSPAKAPRSAFKVRPGAVMPQVEGCNALDYSVLFIVAVEAESQAQLANPE